MPSEARKTTKATADEVDLPRTVDWQNPRVVQILDAAARCFGKNGFAGTSIQDIAREAGLTKSMVHYYFESKQSLIQELQAFVYERHFRKVEQRLAEAAPGASSRAQDALYTVFEIVKDKQFLRLQLEILGECGRDPAVMKRMGVLQKRSRELIAAGASEALGDQKMRVPEEVVSTLIGAVLHGLRVFELVEGEGVPIKEAYDMFVALLLMGLERMKEAQQ